MSDVERNKGVLTPISLETVLTMWPEFDAEDSLETTDGNIVVLKGSLYWVHFEVKCEIDCMYFCELNHKLDGSIHFHTLHYNGGAYWLEVIEDELNG